MPVQAHYQSLLARIYSWMSGDFDEMVARQLKFFREHQVVPATSKIALDLGAGSGFQTLALEHLGFKVHAVDLSVELLSELQQKSLSARIHVGDIRDLSFATHLQPELIVCMGYTITHLESLDEVQVLVRNTKLLLAPHGKFILTYRDLSTPLEDLERFIPVRSDANRILTCFVEDVGSKVKVSDLLYEKANENWLLQKSFYFKLKIPHEWLNEVFVKAGFQVQLSRLANGLFAIIGQKTA